MKKEYEAPYVITVSVQSGDIMSVSSENANDNLTKDDFKITLN